jgi:hypothetical protein
MNTIIIPEKDFNFSSYNISELKGYPIYLAPDKNENESAVYPEAILKSALKIF